MKNWVWLLFRDKLFFACCAINKFSQYFLSFSFFHSFVRFLSVDVAILMLGSGPVKGVSEAILASSSAFSFPITPLWPGTHNSFTGILVERSRILSLHSSANDVENFDFWSVLRTP